MLTNKKFAEEDKKFKKACDRVGLPPTTRQASKYRNKKGLAYKEGR
jgi:hypothetical protein